MNQAHGELERMPTGASNALTATPSYSNLEGTLLG
jgi:hypothetical protein